MKKSKKNHEFAEEEVALVKKKSIRESMSTRKLNSLKGNSSFGVTAVVPCLILAVVISA